MEDRRTKTATNKTFVILQAAQTLWTSGKGELYKWMYTNLVFYNEIVANKKLKCHVQSIHLAHLHKMIAPNYYSDQHMRKLNTSPMPQVMLY